MMSAIGLRFLQGGGAGVLTRLSIFLEAHR